MVGPQKMTDGELVKILDAIEVEGSIRKGADFLGQSYSWVSRRVDECKKRGLSSGMKFAEESPDTFQFRENVKAGTAELSMVSPVKTVEDVLKKAEVDTRIWEVERFIANAWQTPRGKLAMIEDGTTAPTDLWQVKVWFKRKKNVPAIKSIDTLFDRIDGKAPPKPKLSKRKKKDPHLLEVSIFDAHFGKLAWSPETRSNYDLDLARKAWLNGVHDLVHKTSNFEYDRILLPIGNDFFHVNNKMMTTLSGTPQDADGRLQKIFEVGEEAVINTVDYLRNIAPVDVLYVAGNHDETTSYFLSRVLKAYFSNDKDVSVDSSPQMHKYYRYGVTMLGFDHGDKIKPAMLPMIMAHEEPQMWAETLYREWHTGHLHTKEDTIYQPSRTHAGVIHRRLPSISGTDAWHFGKGYNCNTRACEAYIFNKETGPTGHMTSSVVV